MKRFIQASVLMVLITFSVLAQPISSSFQLLKKSITPGSFRHFSKVNNTIFSIGYEFGVRSFCCKSTDGGASWQVIGYPFSPADNLNAIQFLTEQLGYLGGAGGVIYNTTNGGTSWLSVGNPTVYSGGIEAITFLDQNIGWVCGGTTASGNVFKTTDGGTTWAIVPNSIPNRSFSDMLWITPLEAIIVGSGSQYLRTLDGGITWTAGTMPGLATSIYNVKQADSLTFYAVGTAGRVFKSTDRCSTFALLSTPSTAAYYSSEFYDAQNGVILGSNGVVFRTTNGGTSWISIPVFSTEVIRGSLKDGNTIYAGGYMSNLGISTDAGVTWRNVGSTTRDFYGIYAENSQKYTVVGDRGELHQTTDGGFTWNKSAFMTGNLLYDAYTNGSNIYTSGQFGGYFISTNNGANWSDKSIGTTTTRNYKLAFFNANNGFMANNEGGIFTTTNQGNNWSAVTTLPSVILYDIKMLTNTTGFAVGSGERIYATTDGINFTHGTMAVPAGQMTGVNMVSATTGFICGENGALYKTTDGFQTVTLLTDTVALQGKVLHDIVVFSENNVWAVGRGGLIVHRVGNVTVFDTTLNIDFLSASKISSNEFVLAASGGYIFKVSDQIVPVELSSFTAIPQRNEVVLNWETASETNNKGFSVERKSNGVWEEVAFVKGSGTTVSRSSYSFTDKSANGSKSYYRLKQVDYDGAFAYSDEVEVSVGEISFELMQNYPNPFNPSTVIRYSLPVDGFVTLKVYDIIGNEVAVLVNTKQSVGQYSVNFNATALPTGVYFYKLEAGNFSTVKKLSLIK